MSTRILLTSASHPCSHSLKEVCCLKSWEAAAESLDHQVLIPYNPLLVFLTALSNKGREPRTPAQDPASHGPTFETASTASAVRGAFLAGKLLALVGLHTHSDEAAAYNLLQCIFTASKVYAEHICSKDVLPSEANETSMLLSLLVQSSLALARQALKQPQVGMLLTYTAAALTCDLLQSLMQPGSYFAAHIAETLYQTGFLVVLFAVIRRRLWWRQKALELMHLAVSAADAVCQDSMIQLLMRSNALDCFGSLLRPTLYNGEREDTVVCLCIGCPSPRQLLPKENWPYEDEVEDQLEAMSMVAQLMNVMVCYQRLQSSEEATQRTSAFISRTLKPRTCDNSPLQDRTTGNSPGEGATPSSIGACPNSPGPGIAHDSQHPVTVAKTPADSSTFDSVPVSANTGGAKSGTRACNSPTGSTKSPSLGTAASDPESFAIPDVKAAAVKAAHCSSEGTSSSVRQDPLLSGPQRKAAPSAIAAGTAEEHIHLAMISLSALQWLPHQPRNLKSSIATSSSAVLQLLHDVLVQHLPNQDLDVTALFHMGTSIVLEYIAQPLLARTQLQDLLRLWLDRLARDRTLQYKDVLLCEDARLEVALARLMVPIAKRGDNALTLSLMRLDVAYFLLDNVKVAASVAAKHMVGVHNCFKHYASPNGNKAARFTVGAILARLHGKEVQAAIAEDPDLCGKHQPSCGWPEQEKFASEWLASLLDLVYERRTDPWPSQTGTACARMLCRLAETSDPLSWLATSDQDLRVHILGLTGAIMLVKSITSIPEVLDGLMSSMLTLLNLTILSKDGKEHVQEVLGRDGPVLLDRFRVNLPFLKGSAKLTLPMHQQAGISTGAQIEAVPVSLFHCLLSLMSTLEKGRSGDAQDFQTVLPGMMACFWDAVCSASKVVDKQRTGVTIFEVHVEGLKKRVDLSVFLDLLVIFHERTGWKLKYAGVPKPADVVKTILHLLYNLTAELTYTVIECKAAELVLMTKGKETSAESGTQREWSEDCDAQNRQESCNRLTKQLGKALQSAATLRLSHLWQPYFAQTRIAARQWCSIQLHLTGHLESLSSLRILPTDTLHLLESFFVIPRVTIEMSDLAGEQLLAEEQAAQAKADAKKAKKLRKKQKRKQAQQLSQHDEDQASISSSAEPTHAPLSLGCAAQPDQQLLQRLQGCEGVAREANNSNQTLCNLFCCPLTKVNMQDPVIAADGHTYERQAMEDWLTCHNTSPVTGQNLHSLRLIGNVAIRCAIRDHILMPQLSQ
ncbi:hypothetical protein WJX77_005804 [Trebouxia sp. C0004]